MGDEIGELFAAAAIVDGLSAEGFEESLGRRIAERVGIAADVDAELWDVH